MPNSTLENWLTTKQAKELTGYTMVYLRRLANRRQVEARKVGRDWLINLESLLAYKAQMDALGPQRHNPWREGLAQQGRGRNKQTSGGNR
jgi:excisionase family DNA binding protein